MVTILGIYGSPRRDGNTDLLLDEFLKGASASGATIETLRILDKKITPCASYENCFKTGDCIIKDDMNAIYTKLLETDRIVLAAPIYFYNLPAQTKALVDRCQALWARKYILKKPHPIGNNCIIGRQSRFTGILPPIVGCNPAPSGNSQTKRKGFFISVGGTKGANLFEGTILTVKYFFDAIGVTYSGDLLYRSIGPKDAIKQHPTALKETFDKGKEWLNNKD
jgi:multimeric flavodoxin WrbA